MQRRRDIEEGAAAGMAIDQRQPVAVRRNREAGLVPAARALPNPTLTAAL